MRGEASASFFAPMRLWLAISSFWLLAAVSASQALGQAPATDPSQTFYRYKAAILNKDGQTAAEWVTSGTFQMYQRQIDLARFGTKRELKKLPIGEQLQILIMRLRMPRQQLQTMDGRQAFIYAVTAGWSGSEGLSSLETARATVRGPLASSPTLRMQRRLKGDFRYRLEDGRWKLDVTELFQNSQAAFTKIAKESGMKEAEFIEALLEQALGTAPPPQMWVPPFKR